MISIIWIFVLIVVYQIIHIRIKKVNELCFAFFKNKNHNISIYNMLWCVYNTITHHRYKNQRNFKVKKKIIHVFSFCFKQSLNNFQGEYIDYSVSLIIIIKHTFIYFNSRLKQDYLWYGCLQTNPQHVLFFARPNRLHYRVYLLQQNH